MLEEEPSEHLQWPMFITAAGADPKFVNRALLLIQGFVRSEHLADSKWTLFTSTDLPSTTPPPTSSPVTEGFQNDFAGLSPAEINEFMNTHSAELDEMTLTFELWMVLDEMGLETGTCVICKHPYNGGDDDEPATWGYTEEFEGLRVPLDQACAVYASLYTGREFEDYIANGEWPDGTYRFDPQQIKEPTDPEVLERKEKAWQLWQGQGVVD
ncbi:hypothetical protein B0H16DRAFT_1553308 [Mycena metata]|uniref:Uncharacterized protein n=1 Tax=Mycena metata TaxID=1033252 RepID=A0AAD7N6V6_9AGAR|nr:hypothetical protein B0H16DRAFT_1553308 [Mycena metata]